MKTSADNSKDQEMLYETRNDLDEAIRSKVNSILNRRLADAVDLQMQMKQAHWNVKGPNFIGLHELFDRIYESVSSYVDLIAERIVQLGGIAEGTVRIAVSRSSLSDYPLSIGDGSLHVEAVSKALSDFGNEVRSAIDDAEELDDADTTDLLTEVSRGIDKWLWFVEAHGQAAT